MEHDSPQWRARRDELLETWVPDASAREFLGIVFEVAEFYDDVIDQDKPLDERHAIRALFASMIHMPNNEFFARHRVHITPVMLSAINAWLDSVAYERRGDDEDLARAYMLRRHHLELVQLVVFLLEGRARMREVSLQIRDFFLGHETLPAYAAGINKRGS
jgi:hypothetical protein